MNYSKQLCILCEIQPKIVQDSNLNDVEVYPDFTSPNNFVKLFNLKYTENEYDQSLTELIFRQQMFNQQISECTVIQNTNMYLKTLIQIIGKVGDLSIPKYVVKSITKKAIKRAIKHKKWEIME